MGAMCIAHPFWHFRIVFHRIVSLILPLYFCPLLGLFCAFLGAAWDNLLSWVFWQEANCCISLFLLQPASLYFLLEQINLGTEVKYSLVNKTKQQIQFGKVAKQQMANRNCKTVSSAQTMLASYNRLQRSLIQIRQMIQIHIEIQIHIQKQITQTT